MKKFLNLHFAIAVHAILIVCAILIGIVTAERAKDDVEELLLTQIDAQQTLLKELAVKTDSNGADAIVERIITDCPNRRQFELLLVELGTLGKKELIETQQLFESCGSFYAERKALMVSRLLREYEALQNTVEVLIELNPGHAQMYSLGTWSELVDLEVNRSTALQEQVTIQESIIAALISGKLTSSKDVTDELLRAREISESLSVYNTKIDTLRTTLME